MLSGAQTRPAAGRQAVNTLHGFVVELVERYARAAAEAPDGLTLAEAVLRHHCRSEFRESRPAQLAVMGPTQVGKSTAVNLVLGCTAAAVSPLAGFTVHPQGFWADGADTGWVDELFPGYSRVAPHELSRDRLEAYSLVQVESRAPGGCVVWDTPDFDSLAARGYRRSVLETAALADACVVVLSKEKYSDLSAWQMLRLIEPLRRPVLICLNKMTADAAETIAASLRSRLAEHAPGLAEAELVTLPYAERGATALSMLEASGGDLRAAVAVLLERVRRDQRGAQALVRRHWDDWVAPIRAEHAAIRDWAHLTGQALGTLVESYTRDYIEHPQRYDSFKRAAAELLNLLELPGVGPVLGGIRHVLSWPARKLAAAGRNALGGGRRSKLSNEESVLHDAIDEMLAALQRDSARRAAGDGSGGAVWRAIRDRLFGNADALRSRFRVAARTHHELMQREITETASRLYETLQKHPATLAGLRTARATADVASIGLAIKMGGVSVHDLLLAPAMFALVSMLTEGAMGTYVKGIADDLKRRQIEHVRTLLADKALRPELLAIGSDLRDAGLFGVSTDRLREVNAALEAWMEDRGE